MGKQIATNITTKTKIYRTTNSTNGQNSPIQVKKQGSLPKYLRKLVYKLILPPNSKSPGIQNRPPK
jgi:hypothetical protein